MQYFGIPKCPYCKKRVNFIRIWSLRREGEYKCPRCQGISNIFLSPLVHVFAALAIFSSGAIYFFRRFIMNDVQLNTVVEVFVPFVIFYVLSLFVVYLEKPVIKKKKPKKIRSAVSAGEKPGKVPARRAVGAFEENQIFEEDYSNRIPAMSAQNRSFAHPLPDDRQAKKRAWPSSQPSNSPRSHSPARHEPAASYNAANSSLPKPAASPVNPQWQGASYKTEAAPVQRPAQAANRSIEVSIPISPRKPDRQPPDSGPAHVVQKVEIDENVFKKYHDPSYVKERIENEGEKQ